MRRSNPAAAVVLLAAGLTAPALATTQLPRTARPTHYDVSITPDARSLSFVGHVDIAIDLLEPTASLTLHALELTFATVRLSSGDGGGRFGQPAVSLNAGEQTATFTFANQIPVGPYQLALDYTGKIGTQAAGLFAIDYDTPGGSKRALYTQFENSDARRMIPCWDEPAFKATFTLRATIPEKEMAVSNMPVTKTTAGGPGKSLVEFAPSPKMSSYLLFFAMGEFERVVATIDGTEVGVITRAGVTDQAAFALESSKAALHEYNDYFGVPYPLPKLDNIAAPGGSQFFSAMENWGAILTFENAILLDPSISTQSDRQESFTIAAHEISHQWFGDLVTMSWWDDLWLNEGFASWMEGRTTERLHPEWNTVLGAVIRREGAMSSDSLATTHPVVQRIETVEQANEAFDAITYQKGEAVIRMLEAYVGASSWREGIRGYVKAHAYGSTTSDDLWRAVEAVTKKPITAIAHDFTLQPGVPMITVGDAACDGGRTRLTLTQGEYSQDRPTKKALLWRTPVMVKPLGAGSPVGTLVTGGKTSLSLPGCDPVIVNAGQGGYFRTRYSAAPLARLVAGFSRVAPADQLGILNDSWALGLNGVQPMSDLFDIVLATPVDGDPQVWGVIARVLQSFNRYYMGQPAQQARFRSFAVSRLAPLFANLGWSARSGEPDPVAILRAEVIRSLSELEDAGVIAEARRRHAAESSDPAAMPAALRKTILGVVARHADPATWDRLRASALAERSPLVKDELYRQLALVKDEALAKRALELTLTDEPGATNSSAMISVVAATHPDLAFDFALAHKAAVDQKLSESSRSGFYPFLGQRSVDPAMIDKIKAYASQYLAAGSRRDADTAAANVADRVKIRRERLPQIDAWLASKAR